MKAGKFVDALGFLPGHDVEQAGAEQAYIQAELKGKTTWVLLPEEAWPDSWWTEGPPSPDGKPARTPKFENNGGQAAQGPAWTPRQRHVLGVAL